MVTSFQRIGLLAGVSAISLCGITVSRPAFAQAASPAAAASDDTAVPAEDIIVTARRKALENATARKRNSDTIIESVVADDAGKLPDNSITEVLQRLTGVTIVRFASLGDPDRFSAEGSGIQIRGLSGILGTLNGREVFNANGGNGLSFGEVTPELTAAVDVYKASTADRLEGGIAGSIDLRTHLPFDYNKPSVAINLTGGYGDTSRKESYSGSVLATDTFQTGIGKIGYLVDIAYSKFNSADSFIRSEPYYPRNIGGQTRYIPGGFDFGQEEFTRQRKGFFEAVQWEPASNLRFFQSVFISKYESTRYEQTVSPVPNNQDGSVFLAPFSSNAKYDANGFLVSASVVGAASRGTGGTCGTPYGTPALRDIGNGQCGPAIFQGSLGAGAGIQKAENQTLDISQGFTWDVTSRLRVAGALQFVSSYANSTQFGTQLGNDFTSFSLDTTGSLPVFGLTTPVALSDASHYEWTSLNYPVDRNRAHMTAGNVDFTYEVGDGLIRQLQAGGRYADRTERDNQAGTYWAPLGRGWNNSDQRHASDGDPNNVTFNEFDNFFKGAIAAPTGLYLPSNSLLGTFDGLALQNAYGYPDQNIGVAALPHGKEDRGGLVQTQARTVDVYVQARFAHDDGALPFTGNIGLRYVNDRVASTGSFTFSSGTFYLSQAEANADLAKNGPKTNNAFRAVNSSQVITASNHYENWLPSFNINFKPRKDLFVRLAATKTLTKPSYNDIRATGGAGINTVNNANDVPGVGNAAGTSYPPIFTGFSAYNGNTALKPTKSFNLDVSLEYYPSNSTTFHVAGFHKILTDQILYGATSRPFSYTFTRPDGTSSVANGLVLNNEVYNAAQHSFISGGEVGGRTFFDHLPKPFNGFGVEANFTYLDSTAPSTLAFDIAGKPMSNIPIVGLSKYNYNISGLYEHGKLSARLAYSWRSRYLQTTTGNGTNGTYLFSPDANPQNAVATRFSLPVYASPYGQLDAGISYTLVNNVRISLQGTNLTNSITKTLTTGYPNDAFVTRSWFVADRRIEGGLNVSF